MGDPKFSRKSYATPSHPWDGARIQEENQIIQKYGLKNKRELWKTQTLLRDLRRQARELQARQRTTDEQAVQERDALIARLSKLGLLSGEASLNDVLTLEVEAILARRLQTQTYIKGLARTMKQARQFITHGHIAVEGSKVTVPGYLVLDAESDLIGYYHSSPIDHDLHPERPASDFSPEITTVKEERRVAAEKDREMKRSRERERIQAMKERIRGKIAAEEEEKPEEGEDDIDKVITAEEVEVSEEAKAEKETATKDEAKAEKEATTKDEAKAEKEAATKDEAKAEKEATTKDEAKVKKGGGS